MMRALAIRAGIAGAWAIAAGCGTAYAQAEPPVPTTLAFEGRRFSEIMGGALPPDASPATKIELLIKALDRWGQITQDEQIHSVLSATFTFPRVRRFFNASTNGGGSFDKPFFTQTFEGLCRAHYEKEAAFLSELAAAAAIPIKIEPFAWKGTIYDEHDLVWERETLNNVNADWAEGRYPQVVVEKNACWFIHGRDQMHVDVGFSISRADYNALKQGGPVMVAPKTPAPPPRAIPMLRATRIGDPLPPAPPRKIYKPGERPEPPTAPKPKPCPAGKGCVSQEGGPPTPEAIAYERQMRDYEKALAAYEAGEAAKRAAVEEENRKTRQAYDEQLRLSREREAAIQAQAQAQYQAKLDADRAAYDAQMRAHRAEVERIAQEHEAKLAEWRRRRAACLAGDKDQCAPGK